MVRFSIVEDDAATREQLNSFIEKYAAACGLGIDVDAYSSATDFLKAYKGGRDIVFMDIDLPGLNGMEAVRKLRKSDDKVIVIFVTNLAHYAVGGYEVGAFDFIVKPVGYYNFAMKLRRALKRLYVMRGREVWVTTRQGKKLINVSELKYVEVMKHVITYHLKGETVVASGTLKGVCESLEGLPFALCNRCYLVNLAFVTEINGNFVHVGGEQLQISIPRRKEFLRCFNDYLGDGGN